MKRIEDVLTVAELRDLITYDPQSGVLTWRTRDGASSFNARFAGKPVGCLCSLGYIKFSLKIGERVYTLLGHRIAAALHLDRWLEPSEEVDHKNGVRNDNRWENLRICSRAENGKNQSLFVTNTSGFKGVYFNKVRGMWLAQILVDKRRRSIGYYASAEEGARAYDKEAQAHFGEFARTNASMGLL